jgi:hypothetical protein
MLPNSTNTRKRLINSSIKSFFSPTSKETASIEAFNDISTSSNGLVLNITKTIPPKNPVGRPPKLKQVTLVPTNSAGQTEAQVRQADENQSMGENDTWKSSDNGTKSYIAWTDATTGRKLHLPENLYKDVVTSASRFKGQPGFGVRLIKAAASFTYNKAYKHLLDNANWVPSDSWCYFSSKAARNT